MYFTFIKYKQLLKTLSDQGFSFFTFTNYLLEKPGKFIILRHDVDKLPENSLEFAKIESAMGIPGTYYFRVIRKSWNKDIIMKIASMDHEIGYHYEDLGTTARRHKGIKAEEELVKIAIESFGKNLETLRRIAPVKTLCMHGSPMSRWDSRLLWKYYDYRDFGLIGEPYFNVDFEEVFYLTDTGRRWDGEKVSVRDRIMGLREREKGRTGEGKKEENPFKNWKVKPIKYGVMSDQMIRTRSNEHKDPALSTQHPVHDLRFHSTRDIINAAINNRLPNKIMLNFHPQRWTDIPLLWVHELIWQNVKNIGKHFIITMRQ